MKRTLYAIPLVILACAAVPALAAGPVDGEVDLVYWMHEVEVDEGGGGGDVDADDYGLKGELWFARKFGARAALFTSDPDGASEEFDYQSLDVLWRAFSPAENSFFAVGLGFEKIDLNLPENADGARIVAEGRFGFGVGYVYGQVAYAPSLGDIRQGSESLEDLEAKEIELGVRFKVFPFVHVKGGLRQTDLEGTFVDTSGRSDVELDATGFFIGAGVHF